jgi:hypothetical protein
VKVASVHRLDGVAADEDSALDRQSLADGTRRHRSDDLDFLNRQASTAAPRSSGILSTFMSNCFSVVTTLKSINASKPSHKTARALGPVLTPRRRGAFLTKVIKVTERKKPLRVAIDAEGPTVRFLMRALETSDGINELLALFNGPLENVARRLAGCTAADGHSFCESVRGTNDAALNCRSVSKPDPRPLL